LVVSLNGRTEIKNNLAECEANYMQNLNKKDNLDDFNDLFKGKCFLKYKNTEMESLERQIKDLHKLVNPDSNEKTNLIDQNDNDADLE